MGGWKGKFRVVSVRDGGSKMEGLSRWRQGRDNGFYLHIHI